MSGTLVTSSKQACVELFHKAVEFKNLECCQYYGSLSEHYDQASEIANYNGPKIVANIINKIIGNKSVRILDVACGTGLLGNRVSRSNEVISQ